jgi:hypothetical protein
LSWLSRFKRNRSRWPYYDSDYYKNYQPIAGESFISWARVDEELEVSEPEAFDEDRIFSDDELVEPEPKPEPEPEQLTLAVNSEADFEEQLDRIVLEKQDSDEEEFGVALDELIERMEKLGY